MARIDSGTTIQSVLNDPAGSTWIKASLIAALARDPVDAANDADILQGLLNRRCNEHLGQSGASTSPIHRGQRPVGRPGIWWTDQNKL